jgi:hypothetical protein
MLLVKTVNQKLARRAAGVCCRGIWLLFVVLPSLAIARIDIDPVAPVQNFVWSGGSVVVVQNFCVASTLSPQPQSTDIIPYRVEVTGPLAVLNGANQVPADSQWTDLVTSSSTTLAASTPTGYVMTGKLSNCPGGDNGRLTLTFTEAAITSVPPGLYQQDFVVIVRNTGNGRAVFQSILTVTIDIPDSVRVSQLNDIDLGTFSGLDLNGSDSFCVFRASGLPYAVTLTGSGTAGIFSLTNGVTEIPLAVTWDDGTGAVAVSPGVLLTTRVNSFSGNSHCNNGASNNATIAVAATAATVAASAPTSGSYVGTITMIVEQQ